jgi:Mono-functional DNA-alkylating methyl methanesulfonate N-term
VRTEKYASKHDDIFISREDGLVLFAEINSDDPFHLHASMCAGPLGCNIDTAFASLDLGMNRDDLLIAGGDMSVGGLYLVRYLSNDSQTTVTKTAKGPSSPGP